MSRRSSIPLLAVGAVLAASAGLALARDAAGGGRRGSSSLGVATLATSPRVTSIELQGDTVVVDGVATGQSADVTRTRWFELVEGAAYAKQHGATRLTRRVLNASGRLLSTETDPVHTVDPAADVPLTLSESEIAADARERGAQLGAKIVATHYLPVFGGTAELVVQPDDPLSLARTGASIAALLGPLGKAPTW